MFIIISSEALAQSPHAFKYQGVVRDASNTPYFNEELVIDIRITKGGAGDQAGRLDQTGGAVQGRVGARGQRRRPRGLLGRSQKGQ